MAILEAIVPSIINGLGTLITNKSNQANYQHAQNRANEFAQRERLATQEYNSLPNQFAQMAQVGMNPNLLTGQAFQASSPMQNQSVSPPQNLNPSQLPTEGSITQAQVNQSTKAYQDAQKVTAEQIRDALVKSQWSVVKLNNVVSNLNNQQISNLQKQLNVMDEQIKNIAESTKVYTSNIGLNHANEKYIRQQAIVLENTWRANLKKIIADTQSSWANVRFLQANADNLIELTKGVVFQNELNAATRDYQIGQQKWRMYGSMADFLTSYNRNGRITFDLEKQKKYYDIDKGFQYFNSALQVVDGLIKIHPYNQIMNNAKGFIPFGSGGTSPSVGFGSSSSFSSGYFE